jgi:RNA polymerase subunit RPABC4/transcription elongation factor Spt4
VGAVNWRDNQLEPFSSRGPTADGRLKPYLVGPDGVSNAVFAPQGFYGTSAAAPHIAGAAALVWGAYPQATAAEIRDFLINHATDLGATGPDNETGAGLLVLSDPPPPPTPLPPTPTSQPGAPTATPQPTATARPIVLATPNRPRPGSAASSNSFGNWIGLIAIGLALVIGAGVGFSLMRRARSVPQPARSAAAPASDRSACSYCGYRMPADASFCPQCGRPAINPPACARCHTPLRPEAKFCGHCGAPANP